MLVVLLLLKYITKICKNSGRTKLTCGIMENGQYVWRWCFGSSRYCVLGWTRWPDEMWQVSLPYHTCGVHYKADRLSPCFVTELTFGFPGGTGGKEPTCQRRRHKRWEFNPWVGKIPWRRAQQATPVFLPGEYNGRGAWWATVHRVTKSRTQLKWLSTLTSGMCIIGFYGALPLFKIIVVKSMVKWFTIVTIFKV